MRRALLAAVLLLPGCGASPAGTQWRSSAAQPMDSLRAAPVQDATCRQVLRLSAGGERVRLLLSNALSPTPLRLAAATVGVRSQAAAAEPGSLRRITVGGAGSFVVPPGQQVTTDAVHLATEHGDELLVSFAVQGTARLTAHLIGARTGWCSAAGSGDLTGDQDARAFVLGERAALVVEDAAVAARGAAPTVVAAGDSLTDAPLPPDHRPRWTDVLADRLDGAPVANAAIAGNRVLLPGGLGDPLVRRFDRDVLRRDGVGTVVLLAGTNDLARDVGAPRLQRELTRLCQAARERGLRVVLATIPPAGGRTARQQADRRAVNAWIRRQTPADLVVDADAVLRDPRVPERLAAVYDSGDGLHLSAAGHRVLGEAVADVLR